MNTPITKRMQVNRHLANKKSAFPQTNKEESKKTSQSGDTADSSGNLTKSTGTATGGTIEKGKHKKYDGICGTPKQHKANPKRFTSICSQAYRDLEKERKDTKNPCLNHKCEKGTPRKVSDTECTCDTVSPGSSEVDHKPVLTESSQGSIVDTQTASEARNNIKARKAVNKYAEKSIRSYNRSKFFNKFLPIFSSDERVASKKKEMDDAIEYRDVSSDANKAGKNRFITQQYRFLGPDGELSQTTQGGKPVKAPPGTESQEDFENRLNKSVGISAGSSMNAEGTTGSDPSNDKKPGTVTTQTSNFSNLAANQDVKVGTGNLFGNIGLFNQNKDGSPMTKKAGPFKMKGYGSKV